MTYAETRRGRDARGTPAALNSIEISLAGRSAVLAIVSSSSRPAERDTFASGVVSAALVKSFAETANRSLTIATSSKDAGATNIRVGNTGVAQNFARLASACAKTPQRRAGLMSRD
jgi:hypothetical protein